MKMGRNLKRDWLLSRVKGYPLGLREKARLKKGRFLSVVGVLVLLFLGATLPGNAATNALLDLTLNNERGPLSILLKFQGAPVGPMLKNEDRSTWVLTLPETELTFQKGRYHKISVGGLGVNEIEVMPVERDGQKLVRLEVQVQEGFSLVDRSEKGQAQMRLEVLPLPGGRAEVVQPKIGSELLPIVPPEPLIEKRPNLENKLPGESGGLKPLPVGPIPRPENSSINKLPLLPKIEDSMEVGINKPLLLEGDIKGIPFAEELLLGTDAESSGPEKSGPIEKRLLTTRISNLAFRQAELTDVFSLLALKGRFNIVVDPAVKGQVTLTLNQVSIKEALDVLSQLNGIEYKVFESTVMISKADGDDLNKSGEKMVTELIELNYVNPQTAKAMIEKMNLVKYGKLEIYEEKTFEPKSSERPDTAVGTVLLVKETPTRIREIRQLCRKIDRKPRQVHISVRFVELETAGTNEYINRISGYRGEGTNSFSGFNVNDDAVVPSEGSTNFNSLNGFLDVSGDIFKYGILGSFKGYNFASLLKLLVTERLLEVVASPNLITIDGKMGTVDITDKVTYFETGTVTDGGGTTAARKTVDFGVKMTVIPRIDSEGAITMVVEPEVVTPGPIRNGVPDEKTKKVKLTVRIKSGETLALGGLINHTDEETMLKTPFLGDLPLLKKLFRSRSRSTEKKELVIFMTPIIMEED